MLPFVKLVGVQNMPLIGLGLWNNEFLQSNSSEELESTINTALEIGYRHFDTAAVYETEKILGKVLNEWLKNGKIKREDLFITTKLSLAISGPEDVEKTIEKSLIQLNLDYIDLYLIHFPILFKIENGRPWGLKTNHLAIWAEMQKEVLKGRTKAIGLSNFNKIQIQRILDSKPDIPPANLQMENHVFLQQQDLVKFCQENGISVTAYSPLGSPGYNNFLESRGLPKKNLPDLLNDPIIKKIGENHRKTNAQIILRYQIQRKIAVIPKTVNKSRLRENFNILDFNLDDEEMKILDALEVGESARVLDFKDFGLEGHEDYPF